MIAAVNAVRPDVLWVGMTAPKQEKWLAKHRVDLDVGVAGAVGAAFDFFAGTVKRSPRMFRELGLEWLPRLIQQPLRLWRRIFISVPVFFAEVERDRKRRAKAKKKDD
jgi:N-acetylglucosaminyldiphosphoundecaprenol N-acetyl-beta-D-mannosaminyltransferase